jgi:hypothetical protein
MSKIQPLALTDLVVATYCALDDALQSAGISATNGKLIRRRGKAPDVDDREILCCAVLQELLNFESDNAFYLWFEANPVMRELFPRRLSRQNFADRRALLTPLLQTLCGAFCALNGEADPPFSSSIHTPLKSAELSGRVIRPGWAAWRKPDTARPCGAVSTACANI